MRGIAAIAALVVCACGSHGSDDHAPAAVVVDAMPPALVQISADAVTVRGVRVAGVHGGVIDDRDITTEHLKAPRISRFRDALADQHLRPDDRVAVEIDPTTRYKGLVLLAASLTDAQVPHVALISPRGAARIDVDLAEWHIAPALDCKPVDLSALVGDDSYEPPATQCYGPTRPPEVLSMRLFVSLTSDKLLLWSLRGELGTLQAPRVVTPRAAGGYDVAPLRRALREFVDRRWGRGQYRAESDLTIVVQADTRIPVSDVIAVLQATRADADGTPLFPWTIFSTGFE
jgi:hypothetical protein